MRRILIMVAFAVLVALAPEPGIAADRFGEISPSSQKHLRDFRAKQPFHTQVIALSPPAPDGTRTLILSEPPPTTSWQSLVGLLKPKAKGCAAVRHEVMFDGWVYDLVCTLRRLDDNRVEEVLADLNLTVFGTLYGAQVVKLPVPQQPIFGPSLDYRFTSADFSRWLIADKPVFVPANLGAEASLDTIMSKRLRGVFAGKESGLVLWVIDRGGSIDDERATIRRFALEGDMILGAIADDNSVAIVARKRVEPLTRLPPLRAETVQLLAGVKNGEIAQSYERRHVLAGKGQDGIDRAPILLSPELVDTELGSLLNITDQLLKGWSEAGTVTYSNFPYPKPASYPFGDTPAHAVEKDRHQFLFNWNTDGATYVSSVGRFEAVLPQRTGALSIIYGDPANRPRAMEDKAYEYFASSGDANLSRALQYSTIYQIFQHFGIAASVPAVSPRFALMKAELKRQTGLMLVTLTKQLQEDDRKFLQTLFNYHLAVRGEPKTDEAARSFMTQLRSEVSVAAVLEKGEQESGGKLIGMLASLLADPRQVAADIRNRESKTVATLDSCMKMLPMPENASGGVEANYANLNALQQLLWGSGVVAVATDKAGTWKALQAVEAPERHGWIRTAYVVSSRPQKWLTGGHNIDAAMTQFKVKEGIPAGSVKVDRDSLGGITVYYNDKDKSNLREISRMVGTRKAMPEGSIEKEVNAALAKMPKQQPVELAQLSTRSGAHARIPDFTSYSELRPGLLRRAANDNEAKLLKDLKAIHDPTLVIEAHPDGTMTIFSTASDQTLTANTVSAMNDALMVNMLRGAGLGSPVKVVVRGMSEAKATLLIQTANDNIRRLPKGSAKSILVNARGGALDAPHFALVNTKFARNGIKIDRAKVEVKQLADGPFAGAMEVSVPLEIPLTLSGKGTMRARLIFIVKEYSAAARDALLERISSVLSPSASRMGETSMVDLQAELKAALEDDFRKLGIDYNSFQMRVPIDGQFHQIDISRASEAGTLSG